jgi:hypothetical protein
VAPLSGGNSGSLTATINVTVTSNAASTASRATSLTVAGQSVDITQGGTVCSYGLASGGSSAPFGGGTGGVTVTAPAACSWSSSQDPTAPWLTITSSGSGGTADVDFAAAANSTASPRQGTLTIAGQPFTVTEAAAPCSYLLSDSATTVVAAGASGLFTFSTGTSGCSATAQSFANWLTATTSSSADGTSGTVNFTATANPAGGMRTGTIQFAGQTYTVAQNGAPCSYTLAAYGVSFGKAGGTGSVLATPSLQGCGAPPDTTNSPGAITLGTVSPLGNNYTLPYTVLNYNSTVTGTRKMTITFGGQTYTIKQTSY